jgi:hypothetical protein
MTLNDTTLDFAQRWSAWQDENRRLDQRISKRMKIVLSTVVITFFLAILHFWASR